MTDTIRNLDDHAAQHILAVIAKSRGRNPGEDIPWNPGLRQALAGEFNVEPGAAPTSEGELARQALLVLAEDPDTRQAIETMAAAAEQSPQKFDFGASIAITAAVLFVLQTHIKFDRQPDGKWSLQIEKKPTSDALMKDLVQKLISYTR